MRKNSNGRESYLFDRATIADIQRAASDGIYKIRGFGAKRKVPHFDDLVFSTVTISSVRGALIYNTTPNTTSISVSNPSVLVLDFSSDKAASAGDFTIVFPTADASNAIIRIA